MLAAAFLAVAAFAPLRSPVSGAAHARVSAPLCMGKVYDSEDKVIFVDGNNLMMQRKVTKGRDALCSKLAGIKAGRVVVVFDGKPGEELQSTDVQGLEMVVTAGGAETGAERQSADDWIIDQLRNVPEPRIEVVTADRQLRRAIHAHRGLSAKTINPVKWWRRYLPRLKGLKSDYSNAPSEDD